jgi:mycothiol synthase
LPGAIAWLVAPGRSRSEEDIVVHVSEFDPATAPAAALAEYVQLQVEASRADQPAETPTPEAALARLTRASLPGRRRLHWTARLTAGGPLAAVADLVLVGDQPDGLAAFDITVRPEHRRRALGTTLLREVARAAAGRQCLLIEGLRDGSAGQAWAQAAGFAVAQRTLELTLDLRTADQSGWPASSPDGYRLASWTGSTPAGLLASYAAARNAILAAPRGGMSFTEPDWTPERVREEEVTALARNCELRVVTAIHEPGGQVAGLTCLEVYAARPELAVQQDTAVLPAHRGHQLGAWMKAASLRRLVADHPGVANVVTSNAAGNEHMLRVNKQLGFTVAARTENRQARVADLAARFPGDNEHVLAPGEYADIVVTVAHPAGDVDAPLEEWIRTGPGPRPYVGIVAARRRSTGARVALSEIPQEYHNSPQARGLQRLGLLPCPWGPPPEREPS